ncbi:hypothetical protein O3W44_01655 [Pantoea sp. LMR881]|uniref:hypothetical protein n=1 Tax=Pantoea sp. LMR881 TaxID=3014336 RepID=UPI0022AEB419|nr:hypothetical protein [Pantoea sp. LMR881]MCZ4058072.1 hypothetical protein [Pantoea sp. LMR881]
MWRLGASLDDAGSRTTGRYQGGVTLHRIIHHALSDLFIFTPVTISNLAKIKARKIS